ncbi:MAG TPA: hypothetical protein V6D17_11455, partial [Candidatus Obscuribacterales bacterium]
MPGFAQESYSNGRSCKIWIVSGPTCAGKTTLIKSERLEQICGRGVNEAKLKGSEEAHILGALAVISGGGNVALHYNTFKPFEMGIRQNVALDARQRQAATSLDYVREQRWRVLDQLTAAYEREALVLVCDKKQLLFRRLRRGLRGGNGKHKYWSVSCANLL